jgi:hypothetical protein
MEAYPDLATGGPAPHQSGGTGPPDGPPVTEAASLASSRADQAEP